MRHECDRSGEGGRRPQVVGAPLAAALLAMDGFLGLDGWQWLFLAEVPSFFTPPHFLRQLCPSAVTTSVRLTCPACVQMRLASVWQHSWCLTDQSGMMSRVTCTDRLKSAWPACRQGTQRTAAAAAGPPHGGFWHLAATDAGR